MIPSNLVRKVEAGVTYLSPSDLFVECDTTAGQVVVILPTFDSLQQYCNKSGISISDINFRISDFVGNASNNSVLIYANVGASISGNANVEIKKNFQSYILSVSGDEIWSVGAILSIPISEFEELQDIEGVNWDITKYSKAFINTIQEGRLINIQNPVNGDISVLKSNKPLKFNYPVKKTNILPSDGSIDQTISYGIGFSEPTFCSQFQSDGKLIVGGKFTFYNSTVVNKIVRLNVNGSIDYYFNTGTALDGFAEEIRSIIVQPDDKIIIGGTFSDFNGTAASGILRLNADGTIDTSFIYGSGMLGNVQSMSLQSDGKIVAVGNFSDYNGNPVNSIVRLNADGTIDTSFITGSGFNNQCLSVILQDDGKILVGGYFTDYNGTPVGRIVRLNDDGTIDTSFVTGSGFDNTVYRIGLLSNGDIIVGGSFNNYDSNSFNYIVKLSNTGTLDLTFNPVLDGAISAVKIQSDNKILLSGWFTTCNSLPYYKILRLNPDGSIDYTFIVGTGMQEEAHNFTIKPNGNIVATGQMYQYNNQYLAYFVSINSYIINNYSYSVINNGVDTIVYETEFYN